MSKSSSRWESSLQVHHRKLLVASAIRVEVANARNYRSVADVAQLRNSGHKAPWIRPTGLLIPLYNVRGAMSGNQYRPDDPQPNPSGKTLKYITPRGMANFLDVHPLVNKHLEDPSKPLYITEGVRKGDAIVSAGGVAVALLGVYGFRGTNSKGGKTLLADFEEIAFNGRVVYLAFDSDVVTKPEVRQALNRLAAVLDARGATVRTVLFPAAEDGDKVGADDYLAAGHTLADFDALCGHLADHQPSADQDAITEVAAAQTLVREHGTTFRYCPERGRWLRWADNRWVWDIAEEIREYAKQVTRALPMDDKDSFRFYQRANSAIGISGITRLAQTDPAVVVRIGELDAQPYQLNTPGGVLDLMTGNVRPHTTDDLHTKITGCSLSTSDCPKFIAFLSEIFDGDTDLIVYLQRLLGYSCIGTVLDHVLPFCYGAGANGKSVLMNIVMMVLGRDEDGYAIAAPSDFLMARMGTAHPTEIARLRGARFVSCQEVNADQRFDEAKIKQLTGGDALAGRFMHRDFFSFSPTHHLWLAGNHRPEVRDGGPAFWRRVRLIPFNHIVPPDKQNPHLAEELFAEEGPQILGWMATGATAMLRNGLGEPKSVIEATEEYQREEDTVTRFIGDQCMRGDPNQLGYTIATARLRETYTAWCIGNGFEAVGTKAFSQRLAAAGLTLAHERDQRIVKGIRPRTPAEKDKPNDPPPTGAP